MGAAAFVIPDLLSAVAVFLYISAIAVRLAQDLSRRGQIVFFNVEKQIIDVPHAAASAFIRDVSNLPVYEQKVHTARVLPDRPDAIQLSKANGGTPARRTTYQLEGGWCGFPWTATFSMRFTANGGFHSRVIPLRPGRRGITMSVMDIHGGFALRALGKNRTLVTHYESYRWNRHYALLRLPCVRRGVAKWHRDGMRVEMKAIKRGMEAADAAGTTSPPEHLASELTKCHLTFGRFLVQELSGKPYALPQTRS